MEYGIKLIDLMRKISLDTNIILKSYWNSYKIAKSYWDNYELSEFTCAEWWRECMGNGTTYSNWYVRSLGQRDGKLLIIIDAHADDESYLEFDF